jgi:hypothetical protein
MLNRCLTSCLKGPIAGFVYFDLSPLTNVVLFLISKVLRRVLKPSPTGFVTLNKLIFSNRNLLNEKMSSPKRNFQPAVVPASLFNFNNAKCTGI